MNRTGTMDNRAAGIRTVMTGAIFRFIRCAIARKTSGSKVLIDLVKATHGPQNIPATRADRTMLTISHIFRVIDSSNRMERSRCDDPATFLYGE
jgi:hypothetical protein